MIRTLRRLGESLRRWRRIRRGRCGACGYDLRSHDRCLQCGLSLCSVHGFPPRRDWSRAAGGRCTRCATPTLGRCPECGEAG